MILPRTCRECGCTFQGGPRAWFCPSCGAKRRKLHDREMKMRRKSGNYIPPWLHYKLCGLWKRNCKNIWQAAEMSRVCRFTSYECGPEAIVGMEADTSRGGKRGKTEISAKKNRTRGNQKIGYKRNFLGQINSALES